MNEIKKSSENTISIAPFDRLLGIEILSQKDGHAILSLQYRDELTNPYGSLHGGVLMSLADSAMAVAVYSKYPHHIFYTVKTEIRFRSSVKSGVLSAEAWLLGQKRNFIHGKVEIKTESHQLVAEVKSIFCLTGKNNE